MASKRLSCKCLKHDDFSDGQASKIIKLDAKKVKVATQTFMKDTGLLSKHANSICQSCLSYTENLLMRKKKKSK